ncbi:helix-turn-helix domain-containing protein [Micromonospora rifamycinica]|uniref:helix-turn-helix domain-containing protein n=1 Tax=Micromonospora rifamycinica TaxID=291594 RepID=UPI003436E1BF
MGGHEFGAAVRQLREGTAPVAVGLPVGRRRVRRLRREELGELAGMSANYVPRLEQGRSHPSAGVVNAIARALRIGRAEYERLCALAPVTPEQLAALVTLIRDGGTLVNTTVWMPAPADEERGVHGIDLFVRSDADQLADLAARVNTGELRVEVARRVPLADLPALHADAAGGALPSGKVVVTVADA